MTLNDRDAVTDVERLERRLLGLIREVTRKMAETAGFYSGRELKIPSR